METGQGSAVGWTAERVGDALVEAFRALPHMPVYAPRPSRLEAALPGHDPTPLDVLALTERALGRSSPQHRLVLVWARSIATGGDVGGSLREWCRTRGISRSTFDRRRVRACAQIAAEMNQAGEDARKPSGGRAGLTERVERLLKVSDHHADPGESFSSKFASDSTNANIASLSRASSVS